MSFDFLDFSQAQVNGIEVLTLVAGGQRHITEPIITGCFAGRDRSAFLVVGRKKDQAYAVMAQFDLYRLVRFASAHLRIERHGQALARNFVETLERGTAMARCEK